MKRIVKIGGASGFWGDSAVGTAQLMQRANVDYLVLDYLAEITMSIMAKTRARSPALGYATDFVSIAMKSVLASLPQKSVKVITNAGGVNPVACAEAVRQLARDMGVSIKVATVTGDDILPYLKNAPTHDISEMFSGEPLPKALVSANAYLGAFPIAAALAQGADVVITGRCVDSALALGPLIHEFGWKADEFDLLAAGSLVGHLVECGVQATGGIHTDWRDVPDWDDIGFPIAECRADGSFVLTKPEGTGGRVNPAVASEQLVYEIGDPSHYLLPDVSCDFSNVTIKQIRENRVEIAGARGSAPEPFYKVSATYSDGWRCTGGFTIVGRDAAEKAKRAAQTIISRSRTLLGQSNYGDFDAVEIELLGADSLYGPRARANESREVVLRLSVSHRDQGALGVFAKEVAPMGTGGAPGSTGFSGRPKPQEIVRLFSFLLPKELAPEAVVSSEEAGPREIIAPSFFHSQCSPTSHSAPSVALNGDEVETSLLELAWARSGDKGDIANIGVIARSPDLIPTLSRELTEERVAEWFAHLVKGECRRYYMPGIDAFNFVLTKALGGGGIASLRNDPQGKSYAQLLLEMPIRIDPKLLAGAKRVVTARA